VSQQRITEALSSLFSSNPIVFWHDADGEFALSVESLKPSEIESLKKEMQQSAAEMDKMLGL